MAEYRDPIAESQSGAISPPWAAWQDPITGQAVILNNDVIYIPHQLKMSTTQLDGGVILPRGAVRDYRTLDLTKLVMWIRRRGQGTWQVAYTAWQFELDRGLVFRFASDFYALAYGRYECQLNYGATLNFSAGPTGTIVGTIELNYQAINPLRAAHPKPLPLVTPTYPAPPGNITTMYDALVNLSTPLIATLEVGTQLLSLGASPTALLIGVVLAKPVQLQITDGARVEIVEYAGPTSSQVLVQRGAASSTQYRFPIGSIVSFVWTADNVANAVAGP